ncbi:MAG: aspartyl-tRNA amidotransferase subunit B [Chloroflexota bacterium]|nr:MAG: aspartyl-tRNA amidotransferase subunit B [Chloroflexota bacterium]
MELEDQLNNDLKEALRNKETARLSAIRMLKAALAQLVYARTDAKNPDYNKAVTEGDRLRVVENQIKQRREAIELYTRGNRLDLAANEQAELDALSKYMPTQITRDEIKLEVEKVIADLGTREFPKVMKEAATRLKGRADGKLVNEVVKALTAN